MPQHDAELDRLLRSLTHAWRAGEVRPTHETRPKPPKALADPTRPLRDDVVPRR